jgi:hypothetical protein
VGHVTVALSGLSGGVYKVGGYSQNWSATKPRGTIAGTGCGSDLYVSDWVGAGLSFDSVRAHFSLYCEEPKGPCEFKSDDLVVITRITFLFVTVTMLSCYLDCGDWETTLFGAFNGFGLSVHRAEWKVR